MILRIVQFFFGCSHHGVVMVPDTAIITIAHCQLRALHKSRHAYPRPFVVCPMFERSEAE